jgi:hypothetical protein
MVSVKNLGDSGNMTCEVALGALGDASAAPGDEDIFGKAGIRVFDSDKSELDATFAEFFGKFGKFAVCLGEAS